MDIQEQEKIISSALVDIKDNPFSAEKIETVTQALERDSKALETLLDKLVDETPVLEGAEWARILPMLIISKKMTDLDQNPEIKRRDDQELGVAEVEIIFTRIVNLLKERDKENISTQLSRLSPFYTLQGKEVGNKINWDRIISSLERDIQSLEGDEKTKKGNYLTGIKTFFEHYRPNPNQ